MKHTFKAKGKVWKWTTEKAAWHFFTIQKDQATDIKELVEKSNGWGSRRVEVTIGKTKWLTSLFPTKEGEFILPIKKSVRIAERISEGSTIAVTFTNQN